jgi:hypothetical protein
MTTSQGAVPWNTEGEGGKTKREASSVLIPVVQMRERERNERGSYLQQRRADTNP